MRKQALAALWIAAGLCPAASQVFTGFPPVNPPLTGQERIPADTGLSPPSVTFTSTQMAQFSTSLNVSSNWLIAGDASQNLWQRGTIGPTVTSVLAYGPDRWAYWSGAATPMVVSQDLTSVPGFSAAYKMQRVAGASGISPMCMVQEVSSVNSRMLQGQVVEMDFGVLGGANLSAAQVGIYIVTGTGVDEGVSKLAFGFNGGGGGSVGWTGQSMVVSTQFSPLSIGRVIRPAVVGFVPTTAGEVGVVLCMTPSGTAGANDWMDFLGIQLRMAPALAPYVSQLAAYAASALPTPSFAWRMNEARLQQGYYWRLTEGAGLDVVGNCTSRSGTRTDCFVTFPVVMRKVPVMSYVTGFATDSTVTGGPSPGACTALTPLPGAIASARGVGFSCMAATVPPAGTAGFLYEFQATGQISADAELN